MNELLEWLRAQKGGIGTYMEFRSRALKLRAAEPRHAALLRMLADLSGRFVEIYDGEPLPADIGNQAFAKLRELLETAVERRDAPAGSYLDVLNTIGASELS